MDSLEEQIKNLSIDKKENCMFCKLKMTPKTMYVFDIKDYSYVNAHKKCIKENGFEPICLTNEF